MTTDNKESFEEWLEKQPKKTDRLRFKFGIWLYKRTGHVTHYVRDAQDEYLRDNLGLNYGLTVGMWQAKVGLCRPMKLNKYFGLWWKMKLKIRLLLRRFKI